MSDSEIIWKYLDRQYSDDHPAIFLYCCGNTRSPQTATMKMMEDARKLFCPPYTEQFLRTIIHGFLENKKKLYMKGIIKIKPIYGN